MLAWRPSREQDGPKTEIEVTFTDEGGKTRVDLEHAAGNASARRPQRRGRATAKAGSPSSPASPTARTASSRSEERVGVGSGADVLAPELRHDAAARRALQEAELEQVRLVDVLDRVRLLADRGGERREADRAAVELLDDRPQQRAVDALEPALVDLEQVERLARDLGRDRALMRAPRRSRAPAAGAGWRCAACRASGAAISSAASPSISTSRICAERRTIRASSSGS